MKHSFFISTAFALLSPFILSAQIVYVNHSAIGANNGSSWENAFTDLKQALQQNNATIWVAEGTYWPDMGTNRQASFKVKKGQRVYGGFPSSGSPVFVDRNPQLFETILSGDIGVPADTSDNSFHVVTVNENSSTSIEIDGFTVTGGNADYSGGGISLDGSQNTKISVRNCLITGNYSGYEGGGIACDNASLTVEQCVFENNFAVYNGGGLQIWGGWSGEPVYEVRNCLFQYNTAGYEAAGAQFSQAAVLVADCQFESNFSGYGGGAIDFFSGHFSNSGKELQVDRSTFRTNYAEYEGGAFTGRGNCRFTNCLFEGNTTDNSAAAIDHFLFETLDIVNCTFVENASEGSVISSFSWDSLIVLKVANCIFLDNSTPIFDLANSLLAESYLHHSVVQGGCPAGMDCSGGMVFNQDPKFVNAAGGDYHLMANSPCLNSGDNAALPSNILTDLDGHDRIANGIIDMGAYESGGVSGLSEMEVSQISVAPNPVTDGYFTIFLPEAGVLTVFNSSGQMVLPPKSWTAGEHMVTLPSNVAQGVYSFQLRSTSEIGYGKVVVLR